MAEQAFTASESVRLDSTGYGYCTVTCPSGYQWEIEATSVSTSQTSTGVAQPTVRTYRSSAPSLGAFCEGSYAGNQDSSATRIRLRGGESYTAEWTGGTAGSTATLQVQGVQRTA